MVGQDVRMPMSYVICICRSAYGIVCESCPVGTLRVFDKEHVTNIAQHCLRTETFKLCCILNMGSDINIYISVKGR